MAISGFGAILNSTRTLQGRALYRVIMPSLAGGAMLGASLLPWLVDPLGQAFPAWQLPVDIGWQLRSGLFSYGLLCLCCTLYAFFVAYLAWEESRNRARPCPSALRTHSTLAGLLCLIPVALFFTQYLFIDMGSITQLAQHEFQALFIQHHFGYHAAPQFIPIQLNTFDYSTLNGRFTLLLNQIQPGLCLPFLGTFCLLRGQIAGTESEPRTSPTALVREQRTHTDHTGCDAPPLRTCGQGLVGKGLAPIGANLRASVRVEHTGEASSPHMMARQLAPCHYVEASLPRLRPPPRLQFPILDRLSSRL